MPNEEPARDAAAERARKDLLDTLPDCGKPVPTWLAKWDPLPEDPTDVRRQKWIIREQLLFFTPCRFQEQGSWNCAPCAARFRRSIEQPPQGAWA